MMCVCVFCVCVYMMCLCDVYIFDMCVRCVCIYGMYVCVVYVYGVCVCVCVKSNDYNVKGILVSSHFFVRIPVSFKSSAILSGS